MLERLRKWRMKRQLLRAYADECVAAEQAAMCGDWESARMHDERSEQFIGEYRLLLGEGD